MAGDPEGFARAKRELAGASGASDGKRHRERLASVEGAPAELDSAGALLEGKSVRGPWRVEERKFECVGFILSSAREKGVEDAFQSLGRT